MHEIVACFITKRSATSDYCRMAHIYTRLALQVRPTRFLQLKLQLTFYHSTLNPNHKPACTSIQRHGVSVVNCRRHTWSGSRARVKRAHSCSAFSVCGASRLLLAGLHALRADARTNATRVPLVVTGGTSRTRVLARAPRACEWR